MQGPRVDGRGVHQGSGSTGPHLVDRNMPPIPPREHLEIEHMDNTMAVPTTSGCMWSVGFPPAYREVRSKHGAYRPSLTEPCGTSRKDSEPSRSVIQPRCMQALHNRLAQQDTTRSYPMTLRLIMGTRGPIPEHQPVVSDLRPGSL